MCSKVVPLPFVVWGKTFKHLHNDCVLGRFEAVYPSLCAWPWLVGAPDPAISPFSYFSSHLSLCSCLGHVFSSLLNSVLKYKMLSFIYCVPWGVGPFSPDWTWGRWLSEELTLLEWRLLLFRNEHLDSDACKAQLLDMAINSSYP